MMLWPMASSYIIILYIIRIISIASTGSAPLPAASHALAAQAFIYLIHSSHLPLLSRAGLLCPPGLRCMMQLRALLQCNTVR